MEEKIVPACYNAVIRAYIKLQCTIFHKTVRKLQKKEMGEMPMKIKPVIPVYSLLTSIHGDYLDSFRRMSEAGYEYVELLGMNYGENIRFSQQYSVQDVKQAMKNNGITPVTAHERVENLDDFYWDDILKYYDALDCHCIVHPMIWIRTREDALRLAEQLNKTGRYMRRNGFDYLLHTHHFEFRRLESGETLVDIIMDNTDKEYLGFEYDVVWSMRAGIDPIEQLQRLGERCRIIHQKDYNPNFPEPVDFFETIKMLGLEDVEDMQAFVRDHTGTDFFRVLGEGCVDIQKIIRAAYDMDFVRYVVAESEMKTQRQFEIARTEYEVLRACILNAEGGRGAVK